MIREWSITTYYITCDRCGAAGLHAGSAMGYLFQLLDQLPDPLLVENGMLCLGDRNGSRTHLLDRPRGENHAMASLTDNQVREIRRQRTDGVSLKTVATSFGVSVSLVSAIACRKVWKHI